MSKHTPGPWTANGSHIYTPDGSIIAQVHNSGSRDSDYPLMANRDLMSAAPTLLDELAKFAAKANGYDGVPPPKYFGDIDCELHYPDSLKIEFTLGELRAARKAIAAATGEV